MYLVECALVDVGEEGSVVFSHRPEPGGFELQPGRLAGDKGRVYYTRASSLIPRLLGSETAQK